MLSICWFLLYASWLCHNNESDVEVSVLDFGGMWSAHLLALLPCPPFVVLFMVQTEIFHHLL